MISATRYHDFSYGHRVAGHENKCALLHGHNGRVHFTVSAESLDRVGRVLDFSAIKAKLCDWVEQNWDHRFLAWRDDPLLQAIYKTCYPHESSADEVNLMLDNSIVWVPFNPTAENMATYLLEVVGPEVLPEGLYLTRVTVDETRKCSATAEIQPC